MLLWEMGMPRAISIVAVQPLVYPLIANHSPTSNIIKHPRSSGNHFLIAANRVVESSEGTPDFVGLFKNLSNSGIGDIAVAWIERHSAFRLIGTGLAGGA
jgi:hypothetical protein